MHRQLHFPSLRQLRAFEAVARSKSIGVGAKELGLSQPAVTQMITQLETVLAVTLLERRRNGSFPTPLGSVLLPRVQRLFAHIQSALRDPVVGASLSGRETTKSVENKVTDTHIRSLTAIAECGSFAAAARRLNISQPSLHRSARNLERVVRRSLYQRIARGLAPTDHARELARQLKVALRELDYGIEEIQAAQGVFTSRITVGNIPHSGTHLLSTTISRFLALYPGASVRGTQASDLGNRRQRRIFVLESLRRFRRSRASARPRSKDNVARAGALRVDITRSRSSAQGGIRAAFCGLSASPDWACRDHLLGNLQIRSCDKQHDRAPLDCCGSAARRGLDDPSFRLSRAGEK
jgi:DNA-binding transcriptional LysR family regulator